MQCVVHQQQVVLIRRRAWCVDREAYNLLIRTTQRGGRERDMLYALCWHVDDSPGHYIQRRGRRVSRIDAATTTAIATAVKVRRRSLVF